MTLKHVIIYNNGNRFESVKEHTIDGNEAETVRKIKNTVNLTCPMLCRYWAIYDMDGNLIYSKGTDKK